MTPKQEAALRQALEALESCEMSNYGRDWVWPATAHETAMKNVKEAITAIREALAEPKEKYRYGTPLLDAMTGNAEQPAQQGCMRCNTPKKCALHGCSPLTWPAEEPAQQEPVAWVERDGELVWNNREAAIGRNLYISSQPSKPWVGLEESEWREIDDRNDWTTTQGRIDAAEEIEAKLKEKNA